MDWNAANLLLRSARKAGLLYREYIGVHTAFLGLRRLKIWNNGLSSGKENGKRAALSAMLARDKSPVALKHGAFLR